MGSGHGGLTDPFCQADAAGLTLSGTSQCRRGGPVGSSGLQELFEPRVGEGGAAATAVTPTCVERSKRAAAASGRLRPWRVALYRMRGIGKEAAQFDLFLAAIRRADTPSLAGDALFSARPGRHYPGAATCARPWRLDVRLAARASV